MPTDGVNTNESILKKTSKRLKLPYLALSG